MSEHLPKLPRNVYPDRDRHGNVRLYFRVGRGKKIRLREKPGTAALEEEVSCARMGVPYEPSARPALVKTTDVEPPRPDSLNWLIAAYTKRGLPLVVEALSSRRIAMLAEIAALPKGDTTCGKLPFALMKRKHVLEIRDTLRETSGARNNVVKTLSAMFAWAVEAGIHDVNPCAGVKLLKGGEGFHTWTVEEVEQYVERHPPGTMAHRALCVLLFTGLRRADAAIAGRQHLYWRRNDETNEPEQWFRIRPAKTSKSTGVEVDIPVLPEFAAAIETMGNEMTFIVGAHGRPYTRNGLGNKMRDWCDQAGLRHCSAHGLRKAGATIAVENGADHELLKAIYGWTTVQQADHYVKKARRKKVAATAGKFLRLGHIVNK